jgi:ABC-2 type transport system ATP-binding protein
LIVALRAEGTSIVISTHIIEFAEMLCDRLIIVKAGSEVASGTIADFRERATGGRSLEDLFLELTA